MIFVILFSCLSRGPDDQGLSQPRVTIDREGLSGGGLKAAQDRREGEDKISPERCACRRREERRL
jgi:hypothetical protein